MNCHQARATFEYHDILDSADLCFSLRTVRFAFPRCGSIARAQRKEQLREQPCSGSRFGLLLSLDSTITLPAILSAAA